MKPLLRRKFIKKTTLMAFGAASVPAIPHSSLATAATSPADINIVGPKEGYSPQIGTLVSMLNWMRSMILRPVDGMSTKDLDYLFDAEANSIGAMLWHLAATERFYQIHTFEGKKWGDWDEKEKKQWSVASALGAVARKTIKGHDLGFYLDKLSTVREHTLEQLKQRDDDWLLKVDEGWFWGPTNNYCKWFHVCEHESNHNGQIKMIKSRIS